MGDAHLRPELISAYLDSRITSREREDADRHLEACARCCREFDSLQQTRDLLRTAIALPVPRSFVLSEIPNFAPKSSNRAPILGLRAAAFATVAALAVLLASDSLLGTGSATAPVQVGLTESDPLITSGNHPSPELAVPLNANLDLETDTALEGMPTGVGTDEFMPGIPVEESLAGSSLSYLEGVLLSLALLFITASFIVPRLRRS